MKISVAFLGGKQPAGNDRQVLGELSAILSECGSMMDVTGSLVCANGFVLGILEAPQGIMTELIARWRTHPKAKILSSQVLHDRVEREFRDWSTGILHLRETPVVTQARLACLQSEISNDPEVSGMRTLGAFIAP